MLTRTIDLSAVYAGATDASVPVSRPHLAALDGLRFIAAFCVLLAHGFVYVVVQDTPVPQNAFVRVLESLAMPGMTLFFVLSGFVIHLNYAGTATKDWNGTFDFFIARFSRLYPLFLAVFAFDFWRILSVEGYFAGKPMFNFDLFGPLPFFLSFTQTWAPIPYDGHLVFRHYGWATGAAQATGAMWSLSLEFLFYAVYPWVGVLVSRLYGARLAACAVAVALAAIAYCVWCSSHMPAILAFGATHFGPAAAQDFQAWATDYSPFGRMTEFLLGAFAAQQYMLSRRGSGIAARWPSLATATVAAVFLGFFLSAAFFGRLFAVATGYRIGIFIGTCTASLVALLMLLAVRHSTWISRSLSGSTVVKLGEASYSLYLLHWYIMTQWAGHFAHPFAIQGRWAVYILGIAVTLVISRLSFIFFERPSMRWLRRNFKPLRLHLAIGIAFVVITVFSVVAAMQIHAVRRYCATAAQANCSALGIAPAPTAGR